MLSANILQNLHFWKIELLQGTLLLPKGSISFEKTPMITIAIIAANMFTETFTVLGALLKQEFQLKHAYKMTDQFLLFIIPVNNG